MWALLTPLQPQRAQLCDGPTYEAYPRYVPCFSDGCLGSQGLSSKHVYSRTKSQSPGLQTRGLKLPALPSVWIVLVDCSVSDTPFLALHCILASMCAAPRATHKHSDEQKVAIKPKLHAITLLNPYAYLVIAKHPSSCRPYCHCSFQLMLRQQYWSKG